MAVVGRSSQHLRSVFQYVRVMRVTYLSEQ